MQTTSGICTDPHWMATSITCSGCDGSPPHMLCNNTGIAYKKHRTFKWFFFFLKNMFSVYVSKKSYVNLKMLSGWFEQTSLLQNVI